MIELLVVISIIAVLTMIAMPTLATAKELARSAYCLGNLRVQSVATSMYQSDHGGLFWPYRRQDWPTVGTDSFFWGTATHPVEVSAGWYMHYLQYDLKTLWCPEMPEGSYEYQAKVKEPTTTYGYNAFYLDNSLSDDGLKNIEDIPRPDDLFVMGDTAEIWTAFKVAIVRNSTYMEPVCGNWTLRPTNHFRHRGLTNVFCADGHAQSYGPSGWTIDNDHNLGFVGTSNDPHYAQ